MSSTKPIRHSKRKARPMAQQARQGFQLRKILIGVATIVGTLAAVLALFPRLTVSNGAAIDPSDPFSTPFHITNDGYVPLFAVKFFLHVNHMYDSERGGAENITFTSPGKSDLSMFWPTD